MRNKITFILMTFCLVSYGQTKNIQPDKSVDFGKMIEHFKEYAGHLKEEKATALPLIHKNKEYRIEISDIPVFFDIREIVLKNPFDDKFPVSFSVVYQNRLISLFEQGKFVCHTIPSMERDLEFEKEINTEKFEYHWAVDGKLVGRAGNRYCFLNPENKWTEYDRFIPLKNQPKLFEDSSYIAFRDCHGEWGGTVYFYSKSTGKIFFTEATCANSIRKTDEYLALSHSGHMMGNSILKSIGLPDNLSQTDTDKVNTMHNGQALGYTDKSTEPKTVFDWWEILAFSSFSYQEKTVYMVNWRDRTFLAEIENNVIKIINPLFNNDLYTHNPITATYDDTVLMNLDFWGTGREREISCIIIKDGQLIKLDWNKMHRH